MVAPHLPTSRRWLASRVAVALVAAGGLAVTAGLPAGQIAGPGVVPEADIVTVCCWLVRGLGGWLALATLAGILAAAAGPASRSAAVARRVCPRWLRRLTAAAVTGGLVTVLGTPAATAASPGPGGHAVRLPVVSGTPAAPALGWPGLSGPRAPIVAPPAGSPLPGSASGEDGTTVTPACAGPTFTASPPAAPSSECKELPSRSSSSVPVARNLIFSWMVAR